jgi:hypothetical protein
LNSLLPSGGSQKAWLEKDLQNHQDHIWKTAQYHFTMRPHTAKKAERNSQVVNWATLFHQYQVNLAVESDAHCVKWTYPIRPSRESGSDEGFIRDDASGTVYVGEGCWGAPLRANNDDKKWTRNSGSFNQFKWIFVDMDRIEIRTVKTDQSDGVGYVQPYDVFTPPNGLRLWEPSNGSVVTIERYDHFAYSGSLAFAGNSKPMVAAPAQVSYNKKTPVKAKQVNIEISDLSAAIEEKGVAIRWSTKEKIPGNVRFEIQRSTDDNTFQTVAVVNGIAGAKDNYLIHDPSFKGNPAFLSYRIKHGSPSSPVAISDVQDVAATSYENNNFKKLTPDPDNGILRAKYKVQNTSNVSIRLEDHREKVVANDFYKDQRSGNYLRSIDMKKYPNGKYLLTILSDEQVIEQYLVVK